MNTRQRQFQEKVYGRAMTYTEAHRDIMLVEVEAYIRNWDRQAVLDMLGAIAHSDGKTFDEALWSQWVCTDKGKQTKKRMIALQ